MTKHSAEELTDQIADLLTVERTCQCGRLHSTPTRIVLMDTGALRQLPDVLSTVGLSSRGLLVADANTYEAAGQQTTDLLCGAGHEISSLLIEPESGQRDVAANEKAVGLTHQQARDCHYLVAVGSGTINDITKAAATQLGVPYVAVATAPSMTGYSSALAALTVAEIKQTTPATPPIAIVADMDVMAAAPPQMHTAGVGDMILRSPSSTDWKLASLLRGDYFCPWVAQLADQADRYCRQAIPDIKRGDRQALKVLMSGLVIAGIAITMAQTSAPGSGGGHLISHYWDMTALARGRHHSLHGLQVALGDLICFALYEKLWPRLGEIDIDKIVATRLPSEEFASQTRQHYAALIGPEAAEQVAHSAIGKYATGDQLRSQLAPLVADPDTAWAQLEPFFTPVQQLRGLFAKAGLPRTVSECGISPEEVGPAYHFASRIRERYTVLDLAYDLGLLEELREEAFAEAGVI